jgi:hypothetical protein
MNEPVANLIHRALDLCVGPVGNERRRGVADLADDLRHVDWERSDGVRELAFHVLGVPGESRPDFAGTRQLAVAPFCNDQGLALTMPSRGGTLISCQDDLDRFSDDALDGTTTFVINELAGIPSDESGQKQGILTGLHAKLYVIEAGHTARVLLGSANATDAAFGGNVEILVELTGTKSKLGIGALLSTEGGFGAILEPYDRGVPKEDDADDRALADLLRDIAAVPLTGTVERTDDVLAIRLSSQLALPAAGEEFRVTAELITRPGEAATEGTFSGLVVVEVTPFVVLTARHHRGEQMRTVVCAQLVGDPAGRFDEVIACQVNTPEKFLRFLALLLGLAGDTSAPAG